MLIIASFKSKEPKMWKKIIICLLIPLIIFFLWNVYCSDKKPVDELGFTVAVDEPEYGQVSVTNSGLDKVSDIILVIREDFSYVDLGTVTNTHHIQSLDPQKKVVFPLAYVKDGYEIGRVDIWLKCSRGKGHFRGGWSYADNNPLSYL